MRRHGGNKQITTSIQSKIFCEQETHFSANSFRAHTLHGSNSSIVLTASHGQLSFFQQSVTHTSPHISVSSWWVVYSVVYATSPRVTSAFPSLPAIEQAPHVAPHFDSTNTHLMHTSRSTLPAAACFAALLTYTPSFFLHAPASAVLTCPRTSRLPSLACLFQLPYLAFRPCPRQELA